MFDMGAAAWVAERRFREGPHCRQAKSASPEAVCSGL